MNVEVEVVQASAQAREQTQEKDLLVMQASAQARARVLEKVQVWVKVWVRKIRCIQVLAGVSLL
jgi:hypothetical protein